MPKISVDGQELHYRLEASDAGADAPVLMLSHSLGADLSMWDAQIDPFRQAFRVLRYDARGHGASAVTPGPCRIETLGRDALGLLDALSIKVAHFCGLSMGGQVAQWLAIHAPARVGQLVICNSAALIGTTELWNGRIAAVRAGGMAAIVDAVLGRWFTARFHETSPEVVSAMRRVILATPADGYVAACSAIRDADLRSGLHSIGARTLIVAGKDDQSTPVSDAQFLREHIAAAQYLELDAAHISNIEQSARFSAAVFGFLMGGS